MIRAIATLTCPLLLVGCSIKELETAESTSVENSCNDDSDCGGGRCDVDLGVCVTKAAEFDTVLLEVSPPASSRGFGGLRFFTFADDLTQGSASQYEVLLSPAVDVSGKFIAFNPEAREDCSNAGNTSVAAKVTFTPSERILGLNTATYEATTEPEDFEQVFNIRLPQGTYDLYVRGTDDASTASDAATNPCVVVPQLIRGIEIAGNTVELEIPQAEPTQLDVVLPAQGNLDGWVADVVHPVGGQRLSTRASLRTGDTIEGLTEFRAQLLYTTASGDDYVEPGQELIRLSPPENTVGPTVLMHRSGLEVFKENEAVIGQLEPITDPVAFQAWVWGQDAPDVPVPAVVTFTAVQIDGIVQGVFAAFEVTVEVDEDGQVEASLLPGRYRVRTVPEMGSGYAASESMVTVWPPDSGDVQAGRVISVPKAAAISGSVASPNQDGDMQGATVLAQPSRLPPPCEAETCDVVSRDVLQTALAQDPFVPRSVTALVEADGSFEIPSADCGSCTEEAGARFDLTIQPPQGSHFAWLVKPNITVYESIDVGNLKLPLPVVRDSVLKFNQSEEGVLPNSLIRTFIALDQFGEYVADPEELRSCRVVAGDLEASSDERCLSSALQIGEARSDSTGRFDLLLPAELER